MKLDWIKISNILSFKHEIDIDTSAGIQFDDELNIMIGANGAGKSNFLEIINQVFRNFFFIPSPIQWEKIIEMQKLPGNQLRNELNAIKEESSHTLEKNKKSQSTDMGIKIKLKFSELDRENFIFVFQNRQDIHDYLQKYYQLETSFHNQNIQESDLNTIQDIVFSINDHMDTNRNRKILSINQKLTNVENFVYEYLKWFEYLQNIIFIANNIDDKKWNSLKNTFALITASREYQQFQSNFIVDQKGDAHKNLMNKISSESTLKVNTAEPSALEYVKLKLAFEYSKISYDMEKGIRSNKDVDAKQILKETDLFQQINTSLKDALQLELDITRLSPYSMEFNFKFINEKKEEVSIIELSSGQRGVIHFIFSVFGYDLKNGVMIIDEPEIHIHPQIQENYIEIMTKTMTSQNIQFIIATHSPVFVNADTIQGVQRFYLEKNYTKVIKPKITLDEKYLVQTLDYTNSSTIFFSNKVILVEGISDEYFFNHFLKDRKKNENNHEKVDIHDIDILNLEGKGKYSFVKEFLESFRIQSYFIGDLDNILTLPNSIIGPGLKQRFGGNGIANKDIIRDIKNSHHSEWNQIKIQVFLYHLQNIFLLPEGELEDYISQTGSKLENVINFCRNDFDTWKINNIEQIQDMNVIVNKIIKS